MKKSIIILTLIIALSSCNNDVKKNENTKKEDKKIETKIDNRKKVEEKKQEVKKEEIKKDSIIGKNGNRTYVGFVSTSCPHCRDAMPILDKFYKENSKKANMLMVVVNNKQFDGYTIPQKKQSDIEEISYEKLTGKKCGYVPSFVIYDENKKIIEKRCGGSLDIEGLKKALIIEKEVKKENKKIEEKKEENKEVKTNSGAIQKVEKKEEVKDSKKEVKKETKNNLDNKINKNMVAKKGSKVKVNYIGKTKDDGKEFDNSYKRGQTLDFTVQAGQMIKGFDDGVIGMKAGDKKTIEIAPKDGYGEVNPNAKQVIPKAQLADFEKHGIKLEVGNELPTQMGNFKIVAVDDKNVTIDTNHPLAGKTLIFEVEMVEVN